jgi:hypothetical protein
MDEARDRAVEGVDGGLRLFARVGVDVDDGVEAAQAKAGQVFPVVPVAFDERNLFGKLRAGVPPGKDRNLMASPRQLFYSVAAYVAGPAKDENFHGTLYYGFSRGLSTFESSERRDYKS